jgi:D-alanyl-lipoteichoic acid acyltransferase DltB (MBOAT superfamily)
MLFYSTGFIFLFLPTTLLVYFYLNQKGLTIASKAWLVFASLVFYSWWNIKYLPLILCSITFNYAAGAELSREEDNRFASKISKRVILIVGVASNLVLLGYYKYSNFFVSNINRLFDLKFPALNIILPLGISFFTFTQITYLVDAYKGKVTGRNYLNFSLFVTFFPHLLAGPIIHHKEMMPQFDRLRAKIFSHKNFAIGLFLFALGLFKKVVIADTFAVWVNQGFDLMQRLDFFQAWTTSLAYTFQLYFDFSGYTDMAIGLALMFNIILPANFNSPYKSFDIKEFWQRWHITLGKFLKDYIYIPLGGNRKGKLATYSNLMITFLIGGLWHGAGWLFILWGSLHGLALIINRFLGDFKLKMNKGLAWFFTFNFVNIAWIFFRARDWGSAVKVLSGMCNIIPMFHPHHFELNTILSKLTILDESFRTAFMFTSAFLVVLLFKNSTQLAADFKPGPKYLIMTIFLITSSVLFKLYFVNASPFIYFNF